jgi:GNAT superfamily N-acetyltransferase
MRLSTKAGKAAESTLGSLGSTGAARRRAATARIKPFVPSMLDEVMSLALRAWEPVFDSIEQAMDQDVFRHFYPDWRVEQAKAVESACLADGMRVWVACIESRIVGFATVKADAASQLGEICMVATDPRDQRAGVASALMVRVLDWMKQAGLSVAMVETGADPGHAPARQAYERMGFRLFPVARYFKKL